MMSNPFNLAGNRILVTGASSGIGREVARQLAEAGAHLVITGRDEPRLTHVLDMLHALKPGETTRQEPSGDVAVGAGREGADPERHRMLAGDLTDATFLEQLCDLSRSVGRLDGFVHCAGSIRLLPFPYQTEESIRELMEVNYFAPVGLLHRLLKQKQFQKPASVVLISSVTSSSRGTGGGSIYGSSKGALEGLVRSLAIELGRSGIRVNTIAPGMVETEAIEQLQQQLPPEALKKDRQRYPLGRYGLPSDVAHACWYLLSEASSWVTGTRLVIDGGLSAQS